MGDGKFNISGILELEPETCWPGKVHEDKHFPLNDSPGVSRSKRELVCLSWINSLVKHLTLFFPLIKSVAYNNVFLPIDRTTLSTELVRTDAASV